jgi:hypothetical protein
MGKPDSDGKALLDEEPKDVTITVHENPPPYQQIQRGQRVYPTNRAYNWVCYRGDSAYGVANESEERPKRWSGCAVIFVAIPVVLLMTLGVYLLTTMLFWCPTCSHRNAHTVHVHKPDTQLKSPNERLDGRKEMETPPFVPEAQKSSNLAPQRLRLGDEQTEQPEQPEQPRFFRRIITIFRPQPEIEQRPEDAEEEQPHFISRFFFAFHPQQDDEQNQEKAEDKAEQLLQGNPKSENTDIPESPLGGNPESILQRMMGVAKNMLSNVHNFFTFPAPSDQDKEYEQSATEKAEENEKKAKEPSEAKEPSKAKEPEKSLVQENGKELKNLDDLIGEKKSDVENNAVEEMFKKVLDNELDPLF